MSDYFYWITGDPFFIVEAKNDIIKSLNKNSDYIIRDLSHFNECSDIFASIFDQNLFDKNRSIFFHNGELNDVSKLNPIIEELDEDKIFIFLQEKPNKKTKFYKKYAKDISEFPIVVEGDRINRQSLEIARKVLKSYTNWKGDSNLFESIFEFSNYSYGVVVNEIEKIRTLFGSEENVNFEQVKPLLFGTGKPDISVLVDFIKYRKRSEAISFLNDLDSIGALDEYGMYLFYTLMENYKFLYTCCLAKENGIEDRNGIAKIAAPLLNVDDYVRVANRLYYYMDLLDKFDLEKLSCCINAISMSMKEWLKGDEEKLIILKKLVITVT